MTMVKGKTKARVTGIVPNLFIVGYSDHSKRILVMNAELFEEVRSSSEVISVVYIGKASNAYKSGDVIKS